MPPKLSGESEKRSAISRTASLFLGKDHERWAHHDPDRMLGPVWKGVRSAQMPDAWLWNDAPTRRPMHASSLGIIAEHAHAALHVNNNLLEGVPSCSPDAHDTLTASAPALAPSLTSRSDNRHPKVRPLPIPRSSSRNALVASSRLRSPTSHIQPGRHLATSPPDTAHIASALAGALASKAKVNEAPKAFADSSASGVASPLPAADSLIVETRRQRRSRLLRSATEDHVTTRDSDLLLRSSNRIPLYGNLKILSLAPRRHVEQVEGTLYDADGPFREGATSDSLSVRLFYAPESDVSYLITTPDNRVFSAAKRRRWAMDNKGRFFAAMEMKSVEAKMKAVESEVTDPVYACEYENDLRKNFLDDVLDELQKAETLTPGKRGVQPHVLQTEDGKLVRLEEDFPEEAFFAIAGCSDAELYPVIARVFVEAIELLWRLHSHGWMHGDVKLENLMFDEKGTLVMIDFENASPFRGSEQHDGQIQLLSFDWTPPELEYSHLGRRMGPTGDLWALGCNLIRAFALRDGVEDSMVREMLLGEGLSSFFAFRRALLTAPVYAESVPTAAPPPPPPAFGVHLGLVLAHADSEHSGSLLHPARLLRRFAHEAPRLLQYVLAHSVTPSPAERDEAKGLALAREMVSDPANAELWRCVEQALKTSIELSGSAWVRPKLDHARSVLELS